VTKYALFLVPLFFVFSIIFVSTPDTACAARGDAKVGDICGGDVDTDPQPCYDIGCIPPAQCEGALQCENGRCVDKGATLQTITCGCKNKTPTTGSEATGGNAITCPGLPEIFCKSASDACYGGGAGEVASFKLNLKGNDDVFKDKILTGFTCNPKQETAICTCNPVPNKNGFDCHLESDPNIKGTATCDGPNTACAPAPDGALMNEAANQQGPLFDRGGVNIKGVKCAKPGEAGHKVWPTVPPPPPPPCAHAIGADGKCNTFSTALGELGTAPEEFISTLFAVLLSFSGGIALLLIIKAGYQMLTSQGNPERINGGRDQLIAAIVGLIFLIFSFVILQVIGFDILGIPTGPGA
jgi:hypothetical protein